MASAQVYASALQRVSEIGLDFFFVVVAAAAESGSVINAERAAFRSPTFQKKFVNVRKFQLQYVLEDAKLEDEREHAMILLQHTTRCKRHFLFI